MDGVEFKRLIDRQQEVKSFYNEFIYQEYHDGIRKTISKHIKKLEIFYDLKNTDLP